MVWRDAWGNPIQSGDVVEDTNTRRIGRVVYRYNRPCIDIWKEFNAEMLNYIPVERTTVDDAYVRLLAPKSEWYYKLHGRRLNHVEILQKRSLIDRNARTVEPIDMPPWDAPTPTDWT